MSVIPGPEDIRRLRIAAGLTQKELARLAGVSQSLIARIERGTVNPRISTLKRVMDVINRSLKSDDVVEKIMTSPVISVYVDTPLPQVVDIMDMKGISQVPVLDKGNRVVGTIYESTLIRVSRNKRDLRRLLAIDVMEPPLPQVPKNTPISMIESLLLVYPAVLVTDKGSIEGIITKIDLLRYYIKAPT